MSYVIVYYSHYGNGKKLVERLASKLKGDVKVLTLAEVAPSTLPPADVYVFSAPAEAFSLYRPMKKFLKDLPRLDGKKYGIINTHASRKSRLPKMEELLTGKGAVKATELDIQVKGDWKTGNALPEGWEAKVDEMAGKL